MYLKILHKRGHGRPGKTTNIPVRSAAKNFRDTNLVPAFTAFCVPT